MHVSGVSFIIVAHLNQENPATNHPFTTAFPDAQPPETIRPTPVKKKDTKTGLVPYSPLQHYLAEVRRYPLLTREEEQRLVKEYRELGKRESGIQLILSNLRLVVSIAGPYTRPGMEQLDLIQEGNVGLLQALKRYDPSKGARFGTYAAWWIKAYILRYIVANFRLVKIGTTQDQRKLFYNLKKERQKLESQGFIPDTKLLADRLSVRERDIWQMEQRLGNREIPLHQPLGEDSNQTLLDILPSSEQNIDSELAENELKELFRKTLREFTETLNERERFVMTHRILSESPLTLEELGKRFGVTKERSRQLQNRIIEKLRDFAKDHIKDFDQLRF
ncbi:MAG TPA: sigma-70 family RNA polymerase sigma factor [Nitrospirales bacterium]|nr:sigma-70 family RNA polymerase sigma factor [Nitrospirales bacterium]HIO69009.1 sigma-70 family RNA polymerase sigma factor [Nitrospirales bacterium]